MRFVSGNGGEPPTEVAIGRRAEFALQDSSPAEDWRNFDGRATVSFVVDGATVFSREIDVWFDTFWIKFEPGNQAGLLTASWDQMTDVYGSDACTKSISHAVTPVAGNPARTGRASWELRTREKRWHGLRQPHNYAVWKEWVEFDVRPSSPRELAAVGPVEIRVKGGGDTYKLDLPDQWADRNRRFVPPSRLRGKHRFTFTVESIGQVLSRGSFKVKYEPEFGKRIWEGTDAFWNVCINSTREVRSRNGRLYCWEYRYPASHDISGLHQTRR